MIKNPQLDEIYKELEESKKNHFLTLIRISDTELQIIKGHLLIEETLYELLKYRSKKPRALEKSRLTSAQLITLVEALYDEEEIHVSWLYPATYKLNKLRNRLAHNVKPENLEEDIKVFTDLVINNNATSGFKPVNELIYSLGSIHSTFSSLLALNKKIELLPSPLKSLSLSSKIKASKLITEGILY